MAASHLLRRHRRTRRPLPALRGRSVGVLHDGHAPCPDAIAYLQRLRAEGRRVVPLQQSGKRTSIERARLHEISFAEDLFDEVVTSGEATWRVLADRTEPLFRELGARCLLW